MDAKNTILNAVPSIESEALSATAISKLLGYAKSNRKVTDAIINMASEGLVASETHSRGYEIYYRTKKGNAAIEKAKLAEGAIMADPEGAPAIAKTPTTAQSAQSATKSTAVKTITECRLPAKMFGYKISMDESSGKARVTTPEGTVIELEGMERLLVINQNKDFRYIVDTPEDIFMAIDEYTRSQRITSFLVSDLETNENFNKKDISSGKKDFNIVILFVSISRHNKAGKD
jgi:hypothetical protein